MKKTVKGPAQVWDDMRRSQHGDTGPLHDVNMYMAKLAEEYRRKGGKNVESNNPSGV